MYTWHTSFGDTPRNGGSRDVQCRNALRGPSVNAGQSLSGGPPGRDRLAEILSEVLVVSDAVHASGVPRIGPGQAKLRQNLRGRCTGKKTALPCRVGRKAIPASLAGQRPIVVVNMRRTFEVQVT